MAQLNPEQRKQLLAVIHEYIYRARPEVADKDYAEIMAEEPEKLFFAWAGGVEPGQPHYYRVQGPSFLLEFDNTQDHANHIHAVWRDLKNDFGEDLLREHYDQAHSHAK
jgi:hypothetical protein